MYAWKFASLLLNLVDSVQHLKHNCSFWYAWHSKLQKQAKGSYWVKNRRMLKVQSSEKGRSILGQNISFKVPVFIWRRFPTRQKAFTYWKECETFLLWHEDIPQQKQSLPFLFFSLFFTLLSLSGKNNNLNTNLALSSTQDLPYSEKGPKASFCMRCCCPHKKHTQAFFFPIVLIAETLIHLFRITETCLKWTSVINSKPAPYWNLTASLHRHCVSWTDF